jgi:hypothetical protein
MYRPNKTLAVLKSSQVNAEHAIIQISKHVTTITKP